jgi:hypothetical protein
VVSAPIIAELTVTQEITGVWCPHCLLATAVETHYVFTRRNRPDLAPIGRGRSIECDYCERELIEPDVEVDFGDEDPALFTFTEHR